MRPAASPDVAIVGGGPAGSVAATVLARAGLQVVLLERERFPRYHIGESLLSATLPILEAIGVLPRVEAHGFVRKLGGTFQWGRRRDPWSFWFREDPGGRPHAFQVVRSEFDQILLEHARAAGADVHEEHAVEDVDPSDDAPALRGVAADGRAFHVRPRFLIDASGQQALLGHRFALRRFNEFFKNLAIFGYWRGAERLPGELASHILSATFGDGWFWYIPLHDDTMSVGAVVDVRRWSDVAQSSPEETYRGLVARCPAVAARLRAATLVSPVRIVRDYSYDSTALWGRGWLLAGDAACFIDPVFSTGVHLASLAGFLGARAVIGILRTGAPHDRVLAGYEAAYRGAFQRYLRFLYFFYDHNEDADSYFWTARRLLGHVPAELDARASFVRLVSGGGDWDALPDVVEREHARWGDAIGRGRAAALPGIDLLRVRTTERLIAR
jgi:halogenation protein CepH